MVNDDNASLRRAGLNSLLERFPQQQAKDRTANIISQFFGLCLIADQL